LDSPLRAKRFEDTVVAHLDAAYNLARWLTRNDRDAEDLVQEACLRAFKFLDGFRGGNGRAWLLTIVRNTFYSGLKKNQSQSLNVPFDEEGGDADEGVAAFRSDQNVDMECWLQQGEAKRLVSRALDQLPDEFREVIVLRELEELSYREIAKIAEIPLGTVMSRLSRARKLLLRSLKQIREES
jgi:RNA polymerase sigma-70 factor (ECF subfamily)